MTDQMKQISWIRQQAKFLVLQASRQKSPELYAELFIDNLPEFLPEELVLAQMKDAGAVQKLGMLNGDVLKFAPWFEEFRRAVVEFIEQGQRQAADTGLDDNGGTVIDQEPEGGGEADGN